MGIFSNWFKRNHIEEIVSRHTDQNGNTNLRGAYDSIKRRGYDSEEDKMFVAGYAAAQKYAALQRQKQDDDYKYDEDDWDLISARGDMRIYRRKW